MWFILKKLRSAIVRTSSRNMVIALVAVALIIVLGGLAFAAYDGVSWPTGMYWAVTTATTVGYGDVVPKTPTGRVIAVSVMLTAIPLMGYVFAEVAALTVESRMRRWLGLRSVMHLQKAVIVLGSASWVPELLGALSAHDSAVVVLSTTSPSLSWEHVHWVQGDPNEPSQYAALPLATAEAVVLGLDSDADNLLAAIGLRHLFPDLVILSMPESERVAQALRDLGVAVHVARDPLLAHVLAKSLDAPHAGKLLFRLLLHDQYRIEEEPVPANWVGQDFARARKTADGVCLGLIQDQEVYLGLDEDPKVAQGAMMLQLIRNQESTKKPDPRGKKE